MASKFFTAQARLAAKNAQPADDVINTFAFYSDDANTDTAADLAVIIADKVEDFYNATSDMPAAQALAYYLAPSIDRGTNLCSVKVTHVEDLDAETPEGSPILVDPFTLTAAGNAGSQPAETALVATLRTTFGQLQPAEGPGGTRPRSRYTGRLYLGPFNNAAAVTSVSSGVGYPSDDLRNGLAVACKRLANDLATEQIYWSVWSRTLQVMTAYSSVKVDNAWDTQRRRGPKAGAATTTVF